MAHGMQPAAGAATVLQPRSLPSPSRCAASAATAKRQTHQVGCISNFPRKLHLSIAAAESDRLRSTAVSVDCTCTCSGSSSGAAAWSSSRPPPPPSANGLRDRVDDGVVADASVVVISGYWTGPDMDDGCGHVQAILQRIPA